MAGTGGGATGVVDEAKAATRLRHALVDQLCAQGAVRTPAVEQALRTVARHLFLPGTPLQTAYSDDSVVTKRDPAGAALSSVSAPAIVALMLEQLQVAPGQRVLEIGSGGYNAALLREMVGPDGSVTTLDIDAEVVERARQTLPAAGYHDVRVLHGDGEFAAEEFAPYDRIIVTVGAADVPPGWVAQLAGGGRIVVPLRMRGLTRSLALERGDGCLVAREYELCGFVPMQGVGGCAEQVVRLRGDEVGLRVDDEQPVDDRALGTALTWPRLERWSGVTSGRGERFDGLHLWLALRLPRFGVLMSSRAAVEQGLVAHFSAIGTPAVFADGSLAYLGLRPVGADQNRWEFGAYGHGPDAGRLAEQVAAETRHWDGSDLDAHIRVYPVGTPDDRLPAGAVVIDKRHSRVTINWPTAQAAGTADPRRKEERG